MLRTLTLCLALGTSAAAAQDGAAVVLKEHLVTTDAVITLSDLFDNTGEAGAVQLARAPAPGRSVALDPGFIRQTAAREGLYWANAGGVLRVTVERAARSVDAAEIIAMIEETLFLETGRAHAVSLSNFRQSLHAPLDSLGGPELIGFDHDPNAALFRAEIAPYPGGAPVAVAGRARRVADVPVLRRTIPRGETITDDDIRWVRLPENQVRGDVVLNQAELVGMAARRALVADRPLRSFDVAPPVVVARGELVSLTYQVGPLTLTAQARALEDAGAGEFIRFVNLQSNRTVEAWVQGPGHATVQSAHARFTES